MILLPVAGSQFEGLGVGVEGAAELALHLVGEADEGSIVVLDVEDLEDGGQLGDGGRIAGGKQQVVHATVQVGHGPVTFHATRQLGF